MSLPHLRARGWYLWRYMTILYGSKT